MLFHFYSHQTLIRIKEKSNIPSCKFICLSLCRYYGEILRSLHILFSNSESDDAVRDNAAGAIARMIMVQPQSIPLNQVGTTLQFVCLDSFMF